jgi:phosphoadenosine phosphosulfate reductase
MTTVSEPMNMVTAVASVTVDAELEAGLEAELRRQIESIGSRFGDAALASSLSTEDMVLTHAIVAVGAPIDVFVIDTGRLHAETLDLLDRTRKRYGIDILVYRPQETAVAGYVTRFGLNAFYENIDLRHRCCEIRKVEPLERALSGRDAWLTGQRRAQGPERSALAIEERDRVRGIPKFNPLALWPDEAVWEYIRRHDVPFNPLHRRGYPSIGCEPCTRAIKPGEPARAGRWWWEANGAQKECGLHVVPATSPVAAKGN